MGYVCAGIRDCVGGVWSGSGSGVDGFLGGLDCSMYPSFHVSYHLPGLLLPLDSYASGNPHMDDRAFHYALVYI